MDANRRALWTVVGSGVALVLLAMGCVLPGGPDGGDGGGFPGGLPMERVSVAGGGSEADGESGEASISADGRYVAFDSSATNLVAGDSNNRADVFVYDRQDGSIERVSVDSSGTQGNDSSSRPSISADGRFVAFHSESTNLVSGDTNVDYDIFVHDRQSGSTERVSVDASGAEADGGSYGPSISADGRYVAFCSDATNLVAGDTNGVRDVFVYDHQDGSIERVSVDSSGAQGDGSSESGSISASGRFVAFMSQATNLVSGDDNGHIDVFVYDRQSGTTERVSVDSSGNQTNSMSALPSISADGRYVAFESWASNLVTGDTNICSDVFVHDRQEGTTERVSVDSSSSQGNDHSTRPSISADGRYAAFESEATNLVSGDSNGYSDIFVHDRQSGTTERVSVDSSGADGDDPSGGPSISADGRYLAFTSSAANLVEGDDNDAADVFAAPVP